MVKQDVQLWVKADKKYKKTIRLKAAQAGLDMNDFIKIALDLAIEQIPAPFFVEGGSQCVHLEAREYPE